MAVLLKDNATPANTVNFYSNGITLTKKSTNQIKAVKGSNPVIVRLGRTAQISMTGRVYNSTDFNMLYSWGGETVLLIGTSSYLQLVEGTKWLIKNLEIKEKPGFLGVYDVKFDIEYYFTGAVI